MHKGWNRNRKNRPLSLELIDSWKHAQIVVIDEVSFLNRSEFDDLDKRLQEIGDTLLPFGGFSIIFACDFCQFEPVKSTSEQLLFYAETESRFEQMANATVILENKHCFKNDPEWGELLKDFWSSGLTIKQI